jgi:Glycosyl transferases, related to UDP-glucuronosyltransferase
MRILLTTQPAYGHFRPLLPLANALLARGHDVRVATSGLFGSVVVAHGLFAVRAGLEWLESDKSTIPDELRAPVAS